MGRLLGKVLMLFWALVVLSWAMGSVVGFWRFLLNVLFFVIALSADLSTFLTASWLRVLDKLYFRTLSGRGFLRVRLVSLDFSLWRSGVL